MKGGKKKDKYCTVLYSSPGKLCATIFSLKKIIMIKLKYFNQELTEPQLMVHFFQIRNFKVFERIWTTS